MASEGYSRVKKAPRKKDRAVGSQIKNGRASVLNPYGRVNAFGEPREMQMGLKFEF